VAGAKRTETVDSNMTEQHYQKEILVAGLAAVLVESGLARCLSSTGRCLCKHMSTQQIHFDLQLATRLQLERAFPSATI
jgi:hypothetical protein